jgi:hypothetical protein
MVCRCLFKELPMGQSINQFESVRPYKKINKLKLGVKCIYKVVPFARI